MKMLKYFSDSYDLLHETAINQTGMDDFGDTNEYYAGMIKLLSAMDSDLAHRFTDMGRQMALGMIVGHLVARLYTQKGWSRYPEYRNERIENPIFIVGLPRTGTTALHKLLSMDPQFQGVEMWLFSTPMPRPERAQWPKNPEYRVCVENLKTFKKMAPGFAAMHDVVADEVDECFNGLAQNFCDNIFPSSLPIPSYDTWWWQQQQDASYHRYADMLKLVGLGNKGQWLLKNPHHLLQLDSLFSAFPDAQIIQTHRDPAKTIPSLASLLTTAHGVYLGDNIRPELTGVTEAQKWMQAICRSQGAREKHKDQFMDILQRDLLQRPMQTISEVYDNLGLRLSDDVACKMRQWLDKQNNDQKNAHQYKAEDFGLSQGLLHEMFADYIKEYDLV